MKCLFEYPEQQPKELAIIVEKYDNRYAMSDMDYHDTKLYQDEVEAVGYTFDWCLDNVPYNLIKKTMRNYTYNILTNEIVIFEQEKEDENTFNCVGEIVIQLRKEGYTQVINLNKIT